MKKRFGFLVVAASMHLCIVANTVVDSLKEQLYEITADTQRISVLNQIGKNYDEAFNDSALWYYEEAHKLSKQEEYISYLAETKQNMGSYYFKRWIYEPAMTYHLDALDLFLQLGDSSKYADQCGTISYAYYYTSLNEKALPYLLKAIEIKEKLGEIKSVVMLRGNLSEIYMKQNEPDKALACLFEIIEFEPRDSVKEHIPETYSNIGFIYYRLGEYQKALEYFTQSLKLFEETGDKQNIALQYGLWAKSLLALGRYDESRELFTVALGMFKEINDTYYTTKVHVNLSELFNKTGEYTKAAHYAELGAKSAKKMKVLWLENIALQELAKAYHSNGSFEKAYDALLAQKQVNDTIVKHDNIKQIADIHVKYNTEKTEKENTALRVDNANQEKALFRQRKLSSTLIIISLCMLVLGIVILYGYLIKKKINKELTNKNHLILKQQNELSEAMLQLKESNEELEQQKEEIQTQAEILQEANATKDKFFSIIAHDLKTPFNSILGLCELMLRNYDRSNDAKRKELLRSIIEAAGSTYNLLSNLLVWSRSQSNRIEINREKINLASLIASSIQPYMENATAKSLLVQNNITNGATVTADAYTLTTIFGNLFSNAIKFTKPGGTITLDIEKMTGQVAVKVIDTGIGIPGNNINKLFKIAENYSTPGTQKEMGTGLGLILCKEFIEKNQGNIEVDSKEGEGTTFTVTIPS